MVILLANVASQIIEFWPDIQGFIKQLSTSEVYTQFGKKQYMETRDLNNIIKDDLVLWLYSYFHYSFKSDNSCLIIQTR